MLLQVLCISQLNENNLVEIKKKLSQSCEKYSHQEVYKLYSLIWKNLNKLINTQIFLTVLLVFN